MSVYTEKKAQGPSNSASWQKTRGNLCLYRLQQSGNHCGPVLRASLLSVDPDVQGDVVSVIKRADGLRRALLSSIVGVDLVIDVLRETVEAIAAVLFGDKTLDGECLRVLEVN